MRSVRRAARRATFALYRSLWDASQAAFGVHSLYAAIVGVLVVVLTVIFATRGDALLALLPLAAVVLVFLAAVVFYLVRAARDPDQHSEWERLDYRGMTGDLMRLEIRPVGPLRTLPYHDPRKPLLCRVVAPEKRCGYPRGRSKV